MAGEKLKKLGGMIKNAVGIEGGVKETLLPMMAYCSAQVGATAAPTAANTHFTPYLTYIVGLSQGQISLMSTIRGFWDAIIDPFIGVFVDRTRSSFGRHRIYMLIAAIPYGLTYILRWDPLGLVRGGNNMNAALMYYLITGMMVALCESTFSISYNAMLPVVAPGYFERTQYNSMSMFMNTFGLLPTQIISTAIVGIRSTADYTPELYPRIMQLIIPVGIVLSFFILLCSLITKEPSTKLDVLPPLDMLQFFRELRDVFKNKAFRHYFFTLFLSLFASSFISNSDIFFLKDVVKRWDLRSQIILMSNVEMLLFIPTYYTSKKYGKQKTARITTPFFYVGYALGLFIPGADKGGRALTQILLLAREVFIRTGNYGVAFTLQNIFPDIPDVDEMITGRRREATISTVRSFATQMTGSFMASVTGVFLEWFGVTDHTAKEPFFKARARDIHPALSTGVGVRIANAVIPTIFIFIALRQLRKYKMTKSDHELIQRAVKERKEQGFAGDITDDEKATLESIAGQKWDDMWIGAAAREELGISSHP